MRDNLRKTLVVLVTLAAVGVILPIGGSRISAQSPDDQFFDSHFHLTNYVQEGPDIHDFLRTMGDKVGRAALFGIPLQQLWSYR